MQSKKLIHEDDYNSYILDYPRKQFNPFFSCKSREKYVLSELEKRHPCFEGQCKTDVHHVSQNGKGKIWALVMDTGRLAKYRGIPGGKKLYISFLGKSKKPHYKRVFKQRYFLKNRIKLFSFATGVVFFGVALFLWGGSFLKNRQSSEVLALALQSEQKITATTLAMIQKNIVSSKTFMDSLDASLKNGAICTLFNYTRERESQNLGDFKTSIKLALSGIYPEQIYTLFYGQNDTELLSDLENTIKISSTVFNDTVPSLDVAFVGNNYANGASASLAKNDGAVRKLVVDYSGNVQTEDLISQSISFTIAPPNWKAFFQALSTYLRQNNLTFKNLSLSCAKNDSIVSVQFSLSAGKMPTELNKLSILFNAQSQQHKTTTKLTLNPPAISTAKLSPNTQAKKLGVVKKMDGSVISFYAGADGKIAFMEE